MALEIIGAGLGRTGTLSLKSALETLGFSPCHHMTEIPSDPDQVKFWNSLAKGKRVDWEDIYSKYRATVDWPGCHFYADLAERYPDAKVILSLRDPESWYRSMNKTIFKFLREMDIGENHPMHFAASIVGQQTFAGDFSKDNAIAAFQRHNEEVMDRISTDRLLVFEVGQGWTPLCEFLEVPIPDQPYPRTNDSAEFQRHAAEIGATGESRTDEG